MKLFFSGDTILAAPWSADRRPRFLELIEIIRAADVSITNLEIPLTDDEGHPQIDSGGIHLTTSGDIADELRWAGFQMVGHANNHTYDYGAAGVLKTLENVGRSGLVLAGVGTDLQSARAPRYLEHPAGTVALVSMTTCLQHYGRAGRSRPDTGGRPGANPLEIRAGRVLTRIERGQCKLLDRLGGAGVRWSGVRLIRPDAEDTRENLAAIERARSRADHVVVCLHSHVRGPWRHHFARQAVEAGADVVFTHGRHYVQGVEIHRDRPIFYGLGDFAFELHKVRRFPDDTFRRYGLGDESSVEDMERVRRGNRDRGYDTQPAVWRGIAATVGFDGNRLTDVTILPIDLGFQLPDEYLGRPQLAEPDLGAEIVREVARLSQRYGCAIEYDADENRGRVVF